jgi:hypothetical protein
MRRALVTLAVCGVALAAAGPAAAASGWLPHPAGATWTYRWVDSVYTPEITTEKVWVAKTAGDSFTLAWTSTDESLGNPQGAVEGDGTVSFRDTPTGLVNTQWRGTAPPATLPVLCANPSSCGNSLASTLYNVIWGTSSPLLPEPLHIGTTWTSRGGAQGDVTSTNTVVGLANVTLPGFKDKMLAVRVDSQITAKGGDPFGSGKRTVWWVWGVGPVMIEFTHAGSKKAFTKAVLQSTSLPLTTTPNVDTWFPFTKGWKATYRWTNTRHLKRPVVQRIASTGGGRFAASTVSGPIEAIGNYRYALTRQGVVNASATTRSASLVELPALGPGAAPPAERRRFATPFDLMDFGFNPLLPAYPTGREVWRAGATGPDFKTYGVTGTARVTGLEKVTTPAGTFNCLVVVSTLRQAGFPFGSGTRTSWFGVGAGLVKLEFRHGDGSVSVVERIR